MTQVFTWFCVAICVLLLVGGPYVVIRWHRREGQKARAAARVQQVINANRLENAEFTDTAVISAVRDAVPQQPEGRGRAPDPAAPLRYPVPVPRGLPLRASAAASPRIAADGTGPCDVPLPPGLAVSPGSGGRRAPSSIADVGGDPRTTPPLVRAAR